MDVSVIIPTRNRSSLLATTLRSVLRQQRVNIDVIVVDDASTDDTAETVAGFRDPRVRVIRRETPGGVASARNLGASEARGDWLAFIDDDDLWAPNKLFRQLETARASRRDWVYTGAVVFTNANRILRAQRPLPPGEVVAALMRYDAIPGGGSNVAVQRTTWLQVGPFDNRLRNTEDWEMWIRLAKHGAPACVDLPLVGRRLHPSNSSLDTKEVVCGTRLIESLHHTRADWGRLHRWMAHSCLRAGQPRTALIQFARAAAHGEIVGVASDLTALLRERFVRRLKPAHESTHSIDPWIPMAAAWLQEFRDIAPQKGEEARTGIRAAEQSLHT